MNSDLKIIKKKYGEKMMHYCREEFSTILEKEGLLSELIMTHFNENHNLYDDIVFDDAIYSFKNYIYSLVDVENVIEVVVDKSPKELLLEVGYYLYECKTEEDIQKFKKYYLKDEELCTFYENRLESNYVFFAVKKDVDKIKRKDFPNPQRQDLYGTSVISIQFTKKKPCMLSIKNRYNHTVNNPDATFSNNLDNIIPGLTESFKKYYRLSFEKNSNFDFELSNYVLANDGKYYKYNYEIYNVYYCPDNIIINNFEVKKYDKERYIVFDYFIIDLKLKKIISNVSDDFTDTIPNDIDKIEVTKSEKGKDINITSCYGEKIIIGLDNENNLIKYINNNVEFICDHFLYYNFKLEILYMPSLIKCGDYFLFSNTNLQKLNCQNLEQCGNYFLTNNLELLKVDFPNLIKCGNSFFANNLNLQELKCQKLEQCGNHFLTNNLLLQEIDFPNLVKCGNYFIYNNQCLNEVNLPNLYQFGNSIISNNQLIQYAGDVINPIIFKYLKENKQKVKVKDYNKR